MSRGQVAASLRLESLFGCRDRELLTLFDQGGVVQVLGPGLEGLGFSHHVIEALLRESGHHFGLECLEACLIRETDLQGMALLIEGQGGGLQIGHLQQLDARALKLDRLLISFDPEILDAGLVQAHLTQGHL